MTILGQVAAALAKVGIPFDKGEMGCKQLKRVTKHAHKMVVDLHINFGPILPEGAISACIVKLVDLLTVDIANIIAAYHTRVQVTRLIAPYMT